MSMLALLMLLQAPAAGATSAAVIDEAGVVVTEDEDDEVEAFREFLDHVSAEDFDTPGGIEEGGSRPSTDS